MRKRDIHARLEALREDSGATRIGLEIGAEEIEVVAFYDDGSGGGPVVSLVMVESNPHFHIAPTIEKAILAAENYVAELEDRARVQSTARAIHEADHEQ